MQLLIVDEQIEIALETSKKIETSEGDWLFFDSSKGMGHGLYKIPSAKALKNTHLLLNVNDNFLEHLLGLFAPDLSTELAIHKQNNFKDFCIVLNDLLNENKKIYDLSRKDFWIWCEAENQISMGQKLKEFLNVT